jgi:putative phosphoesterase
MKFAVITDIHGNSPALKAVLKDIDQRKLDHIYCLGDIVGIGPDSNEVLHLLSSRKDISYVIGNHDLAVIAAYYGQEPPSGHHNESNHHEWLAARIDSSFIGFLEKMPKKIVQTHLDKRVLFVHYHLNQEEQFISIDRNPSIESLDKFYEGANYNMVCFGHHHILHNYHSSSGVFFNPGALGCFDKPLARYGIIEMKNDKIITEQVEIPYDNRGFLKSYLELEVPEKDFILKVFHGGQL